MLIGRKGATKLVKPLLSFFVALVFLGVDLFGVESASDSAARSLTFKLTPFLEKYSVKGQEEIVVVLFSDRNLPLLYGGDRWPPSYRDEARVLSRLVQAQPRALFWDFVFEPADEEEGGSSRYGDDTWHYFVGAATEAKQVLGNRFVIGAVPGGGADQLLQLPAGLAAIDVAQAAVAWSSPSHQYPLRVFEGNNSSLETPAAILYRHWLLASAENQVKEFDTFSKPSMTLFWSKNPAPTLPKFGFEDADHCLQSDEVRDVALWVGLTGGTKTANLAWSNIQPCFPHSYLNARQIQIANSQDLKATIENKIVLVGAYDTSSIDFVDSPIHGRLPGVFAHAMALDNLIEYGEGYWRDTPPFLDSQSDENADAHNVSVMQRILQSITVLDVIEAFFVLLASLLLDASAGAKRKVGGLVLQTAIVAAIYSGLIYTLTRVFNVFPHIWLSMLTVALLLLLQRLANLVFVRRKPPKAFARLKVRYLHDLKTYAWLIFPKKGEKYRNILLNDEKDLCFDLVSVDGESSLQQVVEDRDIMHHDEEAAENVENDISEEENSSVGGTVNESDEKPDMA